MLPGFAAPDPAPKRTPGRVAADRITAGVHPVTLLPLAGNGRTCGDCAFLREKHSGGWHGWKCGTPDPRSRRRGDGPDVTKRWPACAAFAERVYTSNMDDTAGAPAADKE